MLKVIKLISCSLLLLLFFITSLQSQTLIQKPVLCVSQDSFKELIKDYELKVFAASNYGAYYKMMLISQKNDVYIAHISPQSDLACLIDIIENVQSDVELYPKLKN